MNHQFLVTQEVLCTVKVERYILANSMEECFKILSESDAPTSISSSDYEIISDNKIVKTIIKLNEVKKCNT